MASANSLWSFLSSRIAEHTFLFKVSDLYYSVMATQKDKIGKEVVLQGNAPSSGVQRTQSK